ncbi:MAG: HD domain-containing protein [Gemmatimonadetes bacterium]|nr:HD domain-containing protein [Gemmatimonadota bacterium]
MKPQLHLRAIDSWSDPRSFCGGYPWPLIGELADGADVTACYLVYESRRLESRSNKPYLRLLLGDRSGTIEGMVWDDVDRWEPLCLAESVVGVRARVGSYQEKLQLKVSLVEPLRTAAEDMEYLLPASRRPRERMEAELDTLIASVSDRGLRKLLVRCLGRGSETGRAFRVHPAAKRNHHAYLCGLLEHTVSVATVCARLAAHYQEQGVKVDRDLLLAGALLHDIGKLRELKGFPGAGYTDEGQLLGHVVIGIQMVGREGERVSSLRAERLLLLQHLIASHQGKPEWESPKAPQILEGLLLHYADDLDAKINQVTTLLAGVPAGEWSGYDRTLARSFFHAPEIATSEEVEPVSADDAVELFMDLFRG